MAPKRAPACRLTHELTEIPRLEHLHEDIGDRNSTTTAELVLMSNNSRCLRSIVRATLLGAVLSVAMATGAQAEEVRKFEIASGLAAASLNEFSRQAGVQLLFDPSVVGKLETRAVSGEFELTEALERMLEGTSLVFEFVDEKTIAVLPPGKAGTAEARDARGAAGAFDSVDEVEEVIVRGVRFNYEDSVMSANKMPLSVKDTPQSIKLITQDLIEFSGIRKFEDLYKVDASGGTSHAGDQIPRNYYRGFRSQGVNAIKVDGFRMTADMQLDLAQFERFEIVKGSTSTLYGQNAVGGTLNAISKMPQSEAGGEITLQTASYQHYRGDLDTYGPLTGDGALSYRFIVTHTDEESYVDFAGDRHTLVAPTLRYEIDEQTSIVARGSYQRYDLATYYGYGAQFLGDDLGDPEQLGAENFRLPAVPRSRAGNSPYNNSDKEAVIAQVMLEHQLESWTLRASVQYNDIQADDAETVMRLTDADGYTDASIDYTDRNDASYSTEVNLYGDVELFGRTHTVFIGMDVAELRTDTDYYSNYRYGVDSGFSLLDPDYELLRFPERAQDYEELSQHRERERMAGATLQGLLRPMDDLVVSLGTRYSYDRLEAREHCCEQGASLDPEQLLEEKAFTYQAGATYSLTPDLNVYASYGTTFEPQSGLLEDGTYIDPEEGTAYEIGLKGELPGGQLSYSMAVFHMERTNISQGVPGTQYVKAVGTQRSKGVELDLQGQLLEGWEIYGSLAAMDAEYIEGENEGIQSANAPRFGISLFTSYEIQSGGLRGLGFGAGVVHKQGRDTGDVRFGAKTPIRFLGDFTEVDVRVFYSLPRWQFDLGVSNLFNEKYYSTVFEFLLSTFQANPPRQATATIRYKF
jgi:TonB-dependent siderophore receptor